MEPIAQLAKRIYRVRRSSDRQELIAHAVDPDFGLTAPFMREIVPSWKALRHPGVVGLHRVVCDGPGHERFFVLREYVPGTDLLALLYGPDGPRRLSQDVVLYLGASLCDTLAAIHDQLGAHGALAPGHVLLSEAGTIKVIGIEERHRDVRFQTTRADVYRPSYYPWLNHDQILGDAAAPRGDLFSLGACLWEWATGQRLFARATTLATVEAVARAPIQRVADLRPDLAPDLAAAIDRALQRDPERRFQSAAEMGGTLRASKGWAPRRAVDTLASLATRVLG